MTEEGHKLHHWTQDDREWVCAAYDHGAFCRRCVDVTDDDVTRALVLHVIDGNMVVHDVGLLNPPNNLRFTLTEQGRRQVAESLDPDAQWWTVSAVGAVRHVRRPGASRMACGQPISDTARRVRPEDMGVCGHCYRFRDEVPE